MSTSLSQGGRRLPIAKRVDSPVNPSKVESESKSKNSPLSVALAIILSIIAVAVAYNIPAIQQHFQNQRYESINKASSFDTLGSGIDIVIGKKR